MVEFSKAQATAPIFNAPGAVLALIVVLAGIHGLLQLLGPDWQDWAFKTFSFIPYRLWAAEGQFAPGSSIWSFLTYAFLHGDWLHLIFNSLWLLVFGTPAARYLGTGRFLALSAFAAVTGAVASLIVNWQAFIVMVGASGAVSGLLAAAIPIMYGQRVIGGVRPLSFDELLRSSKALGFMAIWLAVTLFSGAWGWTGTEFRGQGAIAWEAHVGGFIGGLIGFYALARRQVRSG